MRINFRPIGFLGLIGLLFCPLLLAETTGSYRCAKGYVKVEDDKYLVIDKCGTPIASEVLSGSDDFKKEKLVFKFGQQGNLVYFTFFDGKLIEIEIQR